MSTNQTRPRRRGRNLADPPATIAAKISRIKPDVRDAVRDALAQDNLAGGVGDPASDAGRAIDLDGFAAVASTGRQRLRLAWPVDKCSLHPLNREVDGEHVIRVGELLDREGQRDPIECRVPPNWWYHRADEWAVPVGHVQVLRGAHRLQAARDGGWTKIDVVIRGDVDDEDAERILARSDDQRAWSLVDKGRLARAMQGRGLTLHEIAKEFGVGDKGTVSHWIGLSQLPECWQRLVEPGVRRQPAEGEKQGELIQVPASWLRCLESLPAKVCEVVYAAFAAEEVASSYPADWVLSRDNFTDSVEECIAELGPIDRDDKPLSVWVSSAKPYGKSVKYGRLFELTAELEEQLDLVELTIPARNGKPAKTVRRATNVSLYDELQEPLVEQLKQGKIDAAGRRVTTDAAGKPTKPAKKTPELETPKQRSQRLIIEKRVAAEKRREADKRLATAVDAWRLRWTRLQIAQAIQVGDWRNPPLLWWLAATARETKGTYHADPCPLDDLIDAALQIQRARHPGRTAPRSPAKTKGILRHDRRPRFAAIAASLQDEREDEVTAGWEVQVLLIRLILWPQCDDVPIPGRVAGPGETPVDWRPMKLTDRKKLQPVELLAVPAADVEDRAKDWHVLHRDGWLRATREGTQERCLLRQFFELHTREQLGRLAEKIAFGAARRASVTKARTAPEAVDCFLGLHSTTEPLSMPKVLR